MSDNFKKNHKLQIEKVQKLFNLSEKRALFLIFAFVLAATIGFLGYKNLAKSSAANAKNFKAGDIMSDEVMSDYASMTEAEIHSFIKSKNSCNDTNLVHGADISHGYINAGTQYGVKYNYQLTYTKRTGGTATYHYHVENGHFVCMADESFGGESAAHIIWQAAQDYKINPRVLIVLLEKEQGLLTDTWPNTDISYRSATGYGCPDTAACDSQYYGFKNQIRNSAKFFRKNLDGDMSWTNYPVGKNKILYSPYCSERGEVDIKNRATGALYTYTPYQPNQAALNAGYGEGDYCSAYGNRNFYLYYTDWFGDTHTTSATSKIIDKINGVYNKLGSSNYLGKSKTNLERNAGTGIFWIEYEKGFVVGSEKTGYFESRGKIRDIWKKLNFEMGPLGFPTSNIETNPKTGIYWQYFQNGAIVGNDKYGYYESRGKIRTVWQNQGFESGALGFPTSNIENNPKTGIYWQYFQNGAIVGNDKYGYFESRGKIRETWQNQGFESGALGFPTSNIERNAGTGCYWQYFSGGAIVGSDKTGYFESRGKIREYWQINNFEMGKFGFPTSNIKTNGDVQSQTYQKGTIYYNTKTGKVWS